MTCHQWHQDINKWASLRGAMPHRLGSTNFEWVDVTLRSRRISLCHHVLVADVQIGLRFDAGAQLTVLPPGDAERGFGFAVWDDAAPAFRRFALAYMRDRNRILSAPADARCAAIVPVLLALVPRPDNSYDSRAIAVTAPRSHGGEVFDRHLGYLYSKWLHHMGSLITDLTTFSLVPVGC